MDYKILIALIAAGAAIFGALASSLVSFLVGRGSAKNNVSMALADYLAKKISFFEAHKSKLIEEGAKTPGKEQAECKLDPSSAIAQAFDSSFKVSSSILEQIAHYLTSSERTKLLEQRKLIGETLAFQRARAQGILEKNDDWKGYRRELEINMFSEIQDFSLAVRTNVDNELNASVEKLEEIYGMRS